MPSRTAGPSTVPPTPIRSRPTGTSTHAPGTTGDARRAGLLDVGGSGSTAASDSGRDPAESGHDPAGRAHRLRPMPSITRIDFVPIPTQDNDRAAAFYRDVLGLEESPHTVGKPFSEFDLGDTTLSIWDPTSA